MLAQGKLICQIEKGKFNNNIRPIIIPKKDIPITPTPSKYETLFKHL